jgi:alkylated DNA repair dioxygenase AlkB
LENIFNLGFSLVDNFISSEEESFLLNNIIKSEKKKTKSRNSIRRFGSHIPYKSHIISNEIPEYFYFLLERIVSSNLLENKPDSISVNEYFEGQQILPHIDSKSSGSIISILSLKSDAVMSFTKNKEKEILVDVPAKSMIQLKNEIRYDWNHAIKPVKDLRYSIVFRCSS